MIIHSYICASSQTTSITSPKSTRPSRFFSCMLKNMGRPGYKASKILQNGPNNIMVCAAVLWAWLWVWVLSRSDICSQGGSQVLRLPLGCPWWPLICHSPFRLGARSGDSKVLDENWKKFQVASTRSCWEHIRHQSFLQHPFSRY